VSNRGTIRRIFDACVLTTLVTGCASTRPPRVNRPTEAKPKPPTWHMFLEPDAVIFLGGSASLATTAYLAAEPSKDPLGFPIDEGGAKTWGNTIPNWQVAVGTSTVPLAIAASGDESRWYHVKGASESLLTTAALTELSKDAFHRHRPRYGPETMGVDDRKSFFSGHASLTLAATTYTALYLRDHVFPSFEGPAAWLEAPTYAALIALSIWVPYTRVQDNMHHGSDVITGALVGTALSTLFYIKQEHRYRHDVTITPVEGSGAAVMISFASD
jgi:hypothetical protein